MKGEEKWTLRSVRCWHATAYIEKLAEYKVFGTSADKFICNPFQHITLGITKSFYAAKHSDSLEKAKKRLKDKYGIM